MLTLWAGLIPVSPAAFIGLVSGRIDTSLEPGLAEGEMTRLTSGDEELMLLVQFEGPIQPEWLEACRDAGAEIHTYLPEFAYLMTLPAGRIAALRGVNGVSWVGEMTPARAVHPQVNAMAAAQGELDLTVLSIDDRAAKRFTTEGFQVTRTRATQMGWHDTRITVPTSQVDAVSRIPGVFHVEMQPVYERHGERGAQTAAGNYAPGATEPVGPGYTSWLASHGLTGGAGVVVQVQDDGLDQGIDTNAPGTAHPDILGRIAGIFNATTDPLGDGQDGHGQINAGIIMGNATVGTTDGDGYRLGQGVAPQAWIYATKIFENEMGPFEIGSNTLTDLAILAQNAGAIFSSNSWGAAVAGGYSADSAEFDALTRDSDPTEPGNQPMTYFFSAGNSGPTGGTMGSPATAKNVIAVGAGENSDADGTDGCNTSPSDADSIRDVVDFSSRGPDADGRLGPTILAVGTHVQGPVSTSPSYNGQGVCDQYWPITQTDYARSSGTSHSCPMACGAGILVHEYFNLHARLADNPSPAMIRAVLANTATDMAGGNDGAGGTLDPIPNPIQGWGSINLSTLFDMEINALTAFDQQHLFIASGQVWEQLITVVDPGDPLKITLAWTDAPASPGANPTLVNDLNLVVTNGTDTWWGNHFSGGFSQIGGTADTRETLESVHIENPSGTYTVRVEAFNIAVDGVPNVGGSPDQDFALFVWNGSDQQSRGVVALDQDLYGCPDTVGLTVSDADFHGAGMVPVTLFSSSGDSESISLYESFAEPGVFAGAVLLSLGTPTGEGVLQVANGDVLTARYSDADDGTGHPATATDTAMVDCAPPVISNIQVVNVGVSQFTVTLNTDEIATAVIHAGVAADQLTTTVTGEWGTSHTLTVDGLSPCQTYLFEVLATDRADNTARDDADGLLHRARTLAVNPSSFSDDFEPMALPGWTHAAVAGPDNWDLRADASAHSPTHVFSFTPGNDNIGDARLISPPLQPGGDLTFWHAYAIEPSFDGAVLEVSTDGGSTWTDLGPNITAGGYDGPISTSFGSPIGGQMAWTGTRNTMSQVTVDMSAFSGQVRIAFRFASDSSVTSDYWKIDDVSLILAQTCTNLDPVAVDDTASTSVDASVIITPLSNDHDDDGGTLTLAGATHGSHGASTVNAGGTVTYTPEAGYSGVDRLRYTVHDGQGGADVAWIDITVGTLRPLSDLVKHLLGIDPNGVGLDFNLDSETNAADAVRRQELP
ncbi:S8 family serine peptidase [Candidatus Sumerlaeota bacterium]|nr:S8 family serine peptidase [Candidatus Sumerlaeota bacterium]